MTKEKEQSVVKAPATGIWAEIVNYYRETVGELRKVSWPTLPEARTLTIVVLVVVFVSSTVLGLFDYLFSELVRFLIGLA